MLVADWFWPLLAVLYAAELGVGVYLVWRFKRLSVRSSPLYS